jgi:kynureninase
LISHGIIVDFRAPDIVRFGFSPLYNTFTEAGRAAGVLAEIIQNELFLEARYSVRQKVT